MAKPSVCELCRKPHSYETGTTKGDWLEFANYVPAPPREITIGHPEGLAYYCDDHVEAARKLVKMADTDALIELRNNYGDVKWQPPVVTPWWKKLFGWT
jgi:hypothetical protein